MIPRLTLRSQQISAHQESRETSVSITAHDQADPDLTDNSAHATVQYNTTEIIPPVAPVSATLVIKPTTLNINSKGVFTVYVTIAGIAETVPGRPTQ